MSTAAAAPVAGTLRHNQRLNTRNGALQAIAINMVTPFLGIAALRLGASTLEVGLLSSLPALAAVLVMLPTASWVANLRRPQRTTAALFLASRFFYLVLASVPLWAGRAAPLAIALAVGLMNLPGSTAVVGWQAFIARVIPLGRRGVAFADRNRAMAVAGTAAALGAGWLLDRLGSPRGYEVLFAAAFVVGVFEVRAFLGLRRPDPRLMAAAVRAVVPAAVLAAPPVRGPGRPRLRQLWQEPHLRRFTLLSVLWYICWQTPWPLFTQYQVDVLHANNTWLGLITLAGNASTVLAFGYWARGAERRGNLFALGIACAGMGCAPLLYALSGELWQLALANVVIGVFAAGVTLLLFNALLEIAPEEGSVGALAIYNTLVNAAAAVAPLLGVALLGVMGYTGAFLLDTGLRIAGGLAFIWLVPRAAAAAVRPGLGA